MTARRIRNILLLVSALILIVLPFAQKQFQKQSAPTPSPTVQTVASPSAVPILGVNTTERTKTSGCQIIGKLPDPLCTPGAIFPDVTAKEVCVAGYSSSVRNVPESEKREVYAEYGITSHSTGEYEVDHLVSLELGGSNDISNLWPEAANPRPGFHEKDLVENYLHQQVCSGAISLSAAQNVIATDWQKVVMP